MDFLLVDKTNIIQCNQGTSATPLIIRPEKRVFIFSLMPKSGKDPKKQESARSYISPGSGKDHIPFLNVSSFGLCRSLKNPAVLAATIVRLGQLTPMPCTPMTNQPWVPQSPHVAIEGFTALTNEAKLHCLFGGIIQVVNPGQFWVMVNPR